jgi:hypothetical protein
MRIGDPRTDFYLQDLHWRMNDGWYYKDDLIIPQGDSWWAQPKMHQRFKRGLLTCIIT